MSETKLDSAFGPRPIARRPLLAAAASAVLLGTMPRRARAAGKQLTFIANQTDAAQIAILHDIAASYEKDTGTHVAINVMDHEAQKTAIRSYLLAEAPDLTYWYSGNRMRLFVDHGLFEDVSDVVASLNLSGPLGSRLDTVTVNGNQYGLPMGGTVWGIMYRADLFAEKGLTPPDTWDAFLATCEKAKSSGLVPLAIGTKELWPAAVWFDYFDLRLNGLESHTALMNGTVSYLDPRLDAVFDAWEKLIKANYFLPNHTSYAWQQAAAFLVQKKAAMFLLGSFVDGAFPEADKEQLRFLPFPTMKAGLDPFQEYSVESVHIPSHSNNKEEAKRFLAYFYQKQNIGRLLAPTGDIPARSDVPVATTAFTQAAFKTLEAAKGTSQYYDRDTDPAMAQVGLNAFQQFMVQPEQRHAIQQRLEMTRKRVFKV